MKKRLGYTLIELIVVIAILGIVMTIVVPNTNFFKSIQESLEIKELRRDMLYARNKAILDSQDYRITFNLEDNNYTIDRSIGSSRIVLIRKSFEHGTVLSSRDGGNEIIFKANGTIGKSHSIYFNNRLGDMYKLSVTPVSCKINIEKHKSNTK